MKLKYEFDIIKKELIFTYYKIKSGHRLQMFKHRLIFFSQELFFKCILWIWYWTDLVGRRALQWL